MAKCFDYTGTHVPRIDRDRDRIVKGEATLAVIRSKRRLLIQRRLVEIAVVARRAQSLSLEDAPLVDALKRLDTVRNQAEDGDQDAVTRLAELRDGGQGQCRRGAGNTLTALTRRQIRAELRLAGIRAPTPRPNGQRGRRAQSRTGRRGRSRRTARVVSQRDEDPRGGYRPDPEHGHAQGHPRAQGCGAPPSENAISNPKAGRQVGSSRPDRPWRAAARPGAGCLASRRGAWRPGPAHQSMTRPSEASQFSPTDLRRKASGQFQGGSAGAHPDPGQRPFPCIVAPHRRQILHAISCGVNTDEPQRSGHGGGGHP